MFFWCTLAKVKVKDVSGIHLEGVAFPTEAGSRLSIDSSCRPRSISLFLVLLEPQLYMVGNFGKGQRDFFFKSRTT